MLKRIIEDVRKRLTTSSEQPAPDSLVTVLSSNWELVPLAISVLGAKRCLLLYTEEMAEQNRFQPNERTHLESVTNWCNENSVHCKIEPKEFSFDQSMPDDFEKHVNAFRQDDEPLIFDVTPGNKLMNYCFVFDERLTKQGDQFAYLKHSWHDESRGHDPGEEFMVLWPAREMWPRDALLPPASDTDEEGPHDD